MGELLRFAVGDGYVLVELEVGVKLTAGAGAIMARTTAEGHRIVRVTWSPHAGTAGC